MSNPSADASGTPPYPTPYDPSTLQQRIHREIVGISALSEFLAGLGTQGIVSPPPDDPTSDGTQEEMPRQEQMTEMIRIRLDDEFWVDMTPDQVTEFLRRKEACKCPRHRPSPTCSSMADTVVWAPSASSGGRTPGKSGAAAGMDDTRVARHAGAGARGNG